MKLTTQKSPIPLYPHYNINTSNDKKPSKPNVNCLSGTIVKIWKTLYVTQQKQSKNENETILERKTKQEAQLLNGL